MRHEKIAIILAALVIMLCATKSQATDLDIKIDTIGVDTVGLSIDSSWYHKAVDYSSGGTITIADTPLTVHWRYFITPTLHYITDTTYRLTEEQRGWLELQIKMQKKWKDLIPKGGIVDSAIVFMGLVDSVDRPADYDPLKDTNYFYISDAIIDWPYSDTISIDTAVITYIDAVLNARIDSLVKVIEGLHPIQHQKMWFIYDSLLPNIETNGHDLNKKTPDRK